MTEYGSAGVASWCGHDQVYQVELRGCLTEPQGGTLAGTGDWPPLRPGVGRGLGRTVAAQRRRATLHRRELGLSCPSRT